MSSKSRRDCVQCVYFEPNSAYPMLGYCRVRNAASLGSVEACGDFRKASFDELRRELEENGWLFCITCGRVLSSERELVQHAKEHVVSGRTLMDEGAGEEAYTAD